MANIYLSTTDSSREAGAELGLVIFFHLSIGRKVSWTTAIVRQNISRRTQLPEARTISTAIYSLAHGDLFMIR